MNLKEKNTNREYVLFGLRPNKFLVYSSGMANWSDKKYYEKLVSEPEYLVFDDEAPNQKVLEIYKRKYDLGFHVEKLQWNETRTPNYFKQKRIRIALDHIGKVHNFAGTEYFKNDDFYFSMLVGKFETINEIFGELKMKDEYNPRFNCILKNGEQKYRFSYCFYNW
jgi:hypothetical protein